MRQAGVLAAAGIVALETMRDRLVDDHRHARRLAYGLAEAPGVAVDLESVQTNLVYFDLSHPRMDAHRLEAALRAEGIWFHALGARRARMVTHYGVSRRAIDRVLVATAHALAQG
jgi:threonine aldolase